MIKLIIFDYGGVIGSDADEWNTTFSKVLEITGLSSDIFEQIFKKHWFNMKIGRCTMEPFWKEVVQNASNKVSPSYLQEIYNRSIIADTRVLEFIQSLKEKTTIRFVMLLNESIEGTRAKIENFNLKSLFGKIYSSSDLGMAKPQKEIYEYVLKDQNVHPDEVVFIDNQRANVDAAQTLDIKAILFTDLLSLKKDLAKLL
ncbi:MAG: HAD family phosphatase [Patescibacteria group bacterium]